MMGEDQQMPKRLQLCIAGGGTGGHVMPALAIADAVRQHWPHVDVSFIGAQRGLEARLLPARGEQVQLLQMHALQGRSLLSKLRVLCWEIPCAVLAILRAWRTSKPTLLLGVGGYASANGVLAALLAGVPVVLYEQNAVAGMVNRGLARFSKKIMLGFQQAQLNLPALRCIYTGNMVRQSIAEQQSSAHEIPCLLIMGGSQGARFLNQNVPAACAQLQQRGRVFKVCHIVGSHDDCSDISALYRAADVDADVIQFCEDMPSFYARGDLLMARSGAMTVSEVMACALPTIFVPLPSAADQHQYHNAVGLCEQDAALLLDQDDCSLDHLIETLDQTLFNRDKLLAMRQAMSAAAPKDVKNRQLRVLAPWLEALA